MTAVTRSTPADIRSLANAEARFKKLVGKGYLAVAPGERGEPGRLLRNFGECVAERIRFQDLGISRGGLPPLPPGTSLRSRS